MKLILDETQRLGNNNCKKICQCLKVLCPQIMQDSCIAKNNIKMYL